MRSLLRSGVALVAAAALGAGIVLAGTAAGADKDNGNGLGGQPATASQIYLDEIKDYGVCRGVDPSCYHEWGNGWDEDDAEKRILIWSRTAGPRHAHLGAPLAAGLNPPLNVDPTRPNVAQTGLIAWAAERGIKADYTEDLSQFRLNNYHCLLYTSPSPRDS